MFANNEITNRGLLHRALAKAAREVTADEREVWARSIERALEDASRTSLPLRNRVARPAVVLAAAPPLAAIAAVLRHENAAVTRASLDAVRTFMTDGVDSPLYGSDPLAARRGADNLRRLFTERAPAPLAKESRLHPAAA